MPDVQEVFRMATQKVLPDPGALERQNRNQRRRSTQKRTGAYALVAAIVVIGVLAAMAALRSNGTKKPASQPSTTPTGLSGPRLTPHSVAIISLFGGGVQREIKGLPTDAFALDLSPDGTKIAFVTNQDGVNRIGTIGIDGNSLNVITTSVPVPMSSNAGTPPAWSPDGSRIAFVGEGEPGNPDIYVVDADGRNARRLTTNPKVDEWPSWSSDGSRIAYDNAGAEPLDGSGFSPTAEIWSVPANGGKPSRLTHNNKADSEPAYSPDGTQIAFFHGGRIWIMNADGSGARQLVPTDAAFSPRWSPDGSEIVYGVYDASWRAMLERDGATVELPVLTIHVVDVKIGLLHNIRGASVATDANTPDWLPSGDALLINLLRKP